MSIIITGLTLLAALLSPLEHSWAHAVAIEPTEPVAIEQTEMRALLVFVQFRDDLYDGRNLVARGWPLYRDRSRLPEFAHDLLASNAASITDSEITLSRYFYDQSRHTPDEPGRFLLYGDIHPRNDAGQAVTYVTRHPNAYYHRSSGRGYGYLIQEVLDYIFIDQGVDPAQFDLAGDGKIDHAFIIIRSENEQTSRSGNISYSGSSFLGGYGSIGGSPSEAPSYWSVSRQENVTLDWQMSGSFIFTDTPGNMYTQKYIVNLMAHELGHELFHGVIRSTHLMPVIQNRVPANEPQRPRSREYRYGFALMPGSPYTNGGGALTISAHERALMGWIALDTLRGAGREIIIGDLYTTADGYILPLPHGENRVYLTNHQRISYFDRIHRSSAFAFNPPYDNVAVGLMTTGLLATFSTANSNLDVLPANNSMALETWFLSDESPYDGNLYGPTTGRQLTPWTRPNINGCNGYAGDPLCAVSGFSPGWMAIDDIRHADERAGTMRFAYLEDFRTRPIIRSNSWIEPGIDGLITGRVVVEQGATLRILAGSAVQFQGGITIEGGGEVVVEPGADVRFGPVDVRPGGRLTRP
jgi:hypothetical protein